MPIKNIIFDLGGVIVNLELQRTYLAFKKMAGQHFEPGFTLLQEKGVFDKYETGDITTDTFIRSLREVWNTNVSDNDILFAWNSMILDIPAQRLELLSQIKQHYRIFLLSNTNEAHIAFFHQYLQANHAMNDLSQYFEQVYYSYLIGMRKPNANIFEKVLQDNGLDKAATLFIDDTEQHIKGAQQVGLQTIWLPSPQNIEMVFGQNGILK